MFGIPAIHSACENQAAMEHYEKLGSFYLGREYDLPNKQLTPEVLEYDSKDMTTHAVCVGMTGSGKTGLCLSILEEAAIDGVPAIAIDPKGDLGNLLLTFPKLRGEDFEPWVDPSEASRKGQTPAEFAQATADLWRQGLAQWDQTPDRIARFQDAVNIAIYTPGSSAGLPLTVLRSFAAPSSAVLEDPDSLRERITASASGLLALLGIDADPIQSREHILISNLLLHAWSAGRDLDIAAMIQEIQKPPFEKVGILDLESFFPASARVALAMNLNNLLASPSFSSWLEGEPLDVGRLLYTAAGKPRLSIISIAHLSDAERMFFVTILLNEVLSWVRSQPGTSSLRAMLYMDEVFGYFPPVANPPSKGPMLTLLKQARAYGLGVMLATQNPVDLDYKGLSNTGTWFLGRLQTERDKARVIEGLEGASAQAGAQFDRQELEQILAGLGSRVFLMNNVHEDRPVVFQTRWALSYLRGPLTRQQIQRLMRDRKDDSARSTSPTLGGTAGPELAAGPAPSGTGAPSRSANRPILPPNVSQWFARPRHKVGGRDRCVYRPALLGQATAHYVRATYQLDQWLNIAFLLPFSDDVPETLWEESEEVQVEGLFLEDHGEDDADFAEAPIELTRGKNFEEWGKELRDHIYRNRPLTLYRVKKLKEYSEPNESPGDFRVRLAQKCREARDLEVEKLREKYRAKLDSLEKKIQTAEDRVDREQAQSSHAQVEGVLSMGASLVGALLGRKLASRTNMTSVAASARRISRASQQKADVARAQQQLGKLHERMRELNDELRREIEDIDVAYLPTELELDELSVSAKKSEIDVDSVALVWLPWRISPDGSCERLI